MLSFPANKTPPLLIYSMRERLILVGLEGVEIPPLLLSSLLSLQLNNGLELSSLPSPSDPLPPSISPSYQTRCKSAH